MKINTLITAFFALTLFLTACQKNDDPAGASTGTLLSTPLSVNGIFKVDSVLNADNYVDVQVNVTIGGSFTIKSDSINGYSFKKTGTIGTGISTIRLYASGKPLAIGTNTFTIIYGGTACNFSITVFGAVADLEQRCIHWGALRVIVLYRLLLVIILLGRQ